MHYTPNYAMSELALANLARTVSHYDPQENVQHKKYLIMLRNPGSRTISSWWVKENLNSMRHNKYLSFEKILSDGIRNERKLRQCYSSLGFNFSAMVKNDLDLEKLRQHQVLKKCPLRMLNSMGSEKRAHVGKSLYAHALVSTCISLENTKLR